RPEFRVAIDLSKWHIGKVVEGRFLLADLIVDSLVLRTFEYQAIRATLVLVLKAIELLEPLVADLTVVKLDVNDQIQLSQRRHSEVLGLLHVERVVIKPAMPSLVFGDAAVWELGQPEPLRYYDIVLLLLVIIEPLTDQRILQVVVRYEPMLVDQVLVRPAFG